VTVAGHIARRLDLPPSTTRRLLAQVKQELTAELAGGDGGGQVGGQVGERAASGRSLTLAGERPPRVEV
jgi:hypothetical protein